MKCIPEPTDPGQNMPGKHMLNERQQSNDRHDHQPGGTFKQQKTTYNPIPLPHPQNTTKKERKPYKEKQQKRNHSLQTFSPLACADAHVLSLFDTLSLLHLHPPHQRRRPPRLSGSHGSPGLSPITLHSTGKERCSKGMQEISVHLYPGTRPSST